MDRRDIIMMSQEELRRVSIVKQAMGKGITQKKASEIIGVSERHIRRIVRSIREQGDTGIIHKSRGKPSHRKIDEQTKAKVIKLYNKKYWDFGPTFASEKLYELDGVTVNPETLRLWLIGENKRSWQRKGRKHRQWRQRKDYCGEMAQVDGSHHDWLEGRGPRLVLMGYIDDATGTAFARFYDYEGTMPAMDSFIRYIKKYGIPQSIYVDRHSTYKSTREQTIEERLRNEKPMSQFERAVRELGVIMIHANSPQAKGRVERGFRTFQDRLIKEMRLAGVKSKEEANEFLVRYLPKHNKRFSIPAAKEGDLHRDAPPARELKKILSIQTKRCLRNDATIRHNNRIYLIKEIPKRRTKAVTVEDRVDGSVRIRKDGVYLRYKEISPELIKRQDSARGQGRQRKVYIPPADHPWRRYKIKS